MADEVTMETDLYSMFGTVPSQEADGVWIVYGADKDKDPCFKVARAGGENHKYTQALVKKVRPYQRVINNQSSSPDQSTLKLIESLTQQAFVETCLLDWRNVKDKKKQSLGSFTQEKAYKFFKELPELYRDLFEQSQSLATFRQEQVDEAAKN